jgi:hypothetical protein
LLREQQIGTQLVDGRWPYRRDLSNSAKKGLGMGGRRLSSARAGLAQAAWQLID